ncbi:Hypothetical Protein FCC1311_076112 [Hondaea fermentalgiana]|uniref:CUE domain-containing protein n=1 Tax=Hondaea fermentalgiana TaxID=2315210 RepID=A0A2R5GKH9_9STRA|nr:Hypothetical Protein FCC1311_076112 [Hondaea fermentalgiana]|eukprot:GBG31387.1 Hypothetical Protein FCC1311_076112 [Hondaea fermentalgiana]
MADVDALCVMFERMDRAVVEIVLEASGGDVDRACDQLLAMAAEQDAAEGAETDADNQRQEEGSAKEVEAEERDTEQDLESFFAGSSSGAETAATISAMPASASSMDGTVTGPVSAQKSMLSTANVPGSYMSSDGDSSWRKPLPEDFLRLPPGLTAARVRAEQVRQDEIFAQMLADEGFRNELARHAEFRTNRPSARSSGAALGQSSSSSSSSAFSPSSSSATSTSELQAAFNELGEAAKTKFNALATRFRRAAAESSSSSSSSFAASSSSAQYAMLQADDEDDDHESERVRHRKAH